MLCFSTLGLVSTNYYQINNVLRNKNANMNADNSNIHSRKMEKLIQSYRGDSPLPLSFGQFSFLSGFNMILFVKT